MHADATQTEFATSSREPLESLSALNSALLHTLLDQPSGPLARSKELASSAVHSLDANIDIAAVGCPDSDPEAVLRSRGP